jgi:hypothetical protein
VGLLLASLRVHQRAAGGSGTSTLCAQQLTDTDAEPVDRHSRQPRGTHAHRDLMSNTARARQRFGKLPEWA